MYDIFNGNGDSLSIVSHSVFCRIRRFLLFLQSYDSFCAVIILRVAFFVRAYTEWCSSNAVPAARRKEFASDLNHLFFSSFPNRFLRECFAVRVSSFVRAFIT